MPTPRSLVVATLILSALSSAAGANLGELTPDQWREDLRVLDQAIRTDHGGPFHTASEADYTAAVAALDRAIPQLTDHEILVGLTGIVASVNDGHTRLGGWLYDPDWGMSWYPLALYWFSDGLYVRQAHPDHADLVGARVVSIGGHSAEEAQERVARVTAADNIHGKRFGGPSFLVSPEVLLATGVIDDVDAPDFVLERDGRTWTAELDRHQERHPGWQRGFIADDSWVDARDASDAPTPLWLRHVDRTFWYEFLEDQKLLYVQQNQVRDGHGETLESFAERVFQFVRDNEVETLVLDVRINGGGNNYLNRPTILGMIQTEPINRRGRSFTIIGRQTFSACQNLVNELSRYSETIFVGEPTGERVNFFGDTRSTRLPNCGLEARVSFLWWQNHDPRDTRPALVPDLAAELSFADYAAHRDPALEAILSYDGATTSDDILAVLEAEGSAAAAALLRETRQDPVNRYRNLEGEMNALGYRLKGDRRLELAITVFQLNVDEYGQSWNVYDSLAEAYVEAGESGRALELYRKSVELNPTSPTGLAAIERLERELASSTGSEM